MGYTVVSQCVVCDRNMSETKNEAYALAKCSLSVDYGGGASTRVDSTKKFVICTACLMTLMLEKKYPGLTVSRDIAQDLLLKRVGGKTYIGNKDKVLTEKSTQKDVDDLRVIKVRNLLKGD